MDDAATTPSRIPSVQRSPRLSSRAAGSKRPTIREGDLPPSKVLKTSGFVASLQKVAKESGDLEEELDFTLCTNITRSDQVLIITCLRIEHLSRAPPFLYVHCNCIFLHVTIHVIDMLVALCTVLWSRHILFTIFSTQVLFAGSCYKWDTLPLYYILLVSHILKYIKIVLVQFDNRVIYKA